MVGSTPEKDRETLVYNSQLAHKIENLATKYNELISISIEQFAHDTAMQIEVAPGLKPHTLEARLRSPVEFAEFVGNEEGRNWFATNPFLGIGSTEHDAIGDLASQICNKTLYFDLGNRKAAVLPLPRIEHGNYPTFCKNRESTIQFLEDQQGKSISVVRFIQALELSIELNQHGIVLTNDSVPGSVHISIVAEDNHRDLYRLFGKGSNAEEALLHFISDLKGKKFLLNLGEGPRLLEPPLLITEGDLNRLLCRITR